MNATAGGGAADVNSCFHHSPQTNFHAFRIIRMCIIIIHFHMHTSAGEYGQKFSVAPSSATDSIVCVCVWAGYIPPDFPSPAKFFKYPRLQSEREKDWLVVVVVQIVIIVLVGSCVELFHATLFPFKFSFYCLLSLGRRFHLNFMSCYHIQHISNPSTIRSI